MKNASSRIHQSDCARYCRLFWNAFDAHRRQDFAHSRGRQPNEVINDQEAPDRAALTDTLRFFNLHYAILHRDQLDPERITRIDSYLPRCARGDSDLPGRHRDEQFPTPTPAPDSLTLNVADNSSLMYLRRRLADQNLSQRSMANTGVD